MSKIDYSKFKQESSWQPTKAYLEGVNAWPKLGVAQNPYPSGSQEAFDWELGWCNAEGYDNFNGIS